MIISKFIPRIEKEEVKYQEIKKDMDEIAKIFSKKNITTIKEKYLKKFLNLFQSEKTFCEELNKLQDFFHIQENENFDYLIFIFKKELIKNIVSSYINILKKLSVNLIIFSKIDEKK